MIHASHTKLQRIAIRYQRKALSVHSVTAQSARPARRIDHFSDVCMLR